MARPGRPLRDALVRAGARHRVAVAAAVFGLFAALAASPATVLAAKVVAPPALVREHMHQSGTFSFKTPEGWTVEPLPTDPDALVAGGDGVLVRFVYRAGENGYDSFHGACMLERLAPPMDTSPNVKYEYDFVGGVIANRRALDSAFVVEYDRPIQGERVWRQRNVSVVGEGQSLCLVSYAPLSRWKKSAQTRALLDAVLGSVTFH